MVSDFCTALSTRGIRRLSTQPSIHSIITAQLIISSSTMATLMSALPSSLIKQNGHDDQFLPPPPPVESELPPPPSIEPPPPPSDHEARPPPPPPAATYDIPSSILYDQTSLPAPVATELLKRKRGWDDTPKRQPLSIEDVLAKQGETERLAKKPKYLSKAGREQLALAKREKEVADRRENSSGDSQPFGFGRDLVRKPNTETSPMLSGILRNNAIKAVPRGPRTERGTGVPTGPAAMRGRHAPQYNNSKEIAQQPPPSRTPSTQSKSLVIQPPRKMTAEEVEAQLIKQRYLGQEQKSTFSAGKKRRKTTEKKFNFEWSTEEDTSHANNPLYISQAQVSGFGRGRLGGFAEEAASEVANRYAMALQRTDSEAGSARAKQILEMERRKRDGEFGARGSIDKHWSQKPLSQMRERDWRIFKEDFNISTKGGQIPNPMRSWEESKLPKRLLDLVAEVGYTDPSAIQRAAIPISLQSRDVIGVAVTGSGKTAAFILPLLVYISEMPSLDGIAREDGPYAIVLAPTRELAQQIESETKKFATPLGFKCVSLVGGHSMEEQIYALRDGAEIIIATPGRLVDMIERRALILRQCCYVIMDEADRMIDLGFEDSVNTILDALPVGNLKPDTDAAEDASLMSKYLGGKDRYRQTMMYTATMPAAIERIAKKYLRRPAIVTIGNVGEAVDTVEQRVEFVAGEDKRKKRLAEILQDPAFHKPVIVFVNIKRNCDAVARDIKHLGLNAVTLHGSKTQDQREAALNSVRRGEADVLVATDLAGRGIDVQDVSLVVNFNMAGSIESYTHRIGRTGRAGKTGVALTFLGNEDEEVLYDLKMMLSKASRTRGLEELKRHPAAQQRFVKGQKQERGGG